MQRSIALAGLSVLVVFSLLACAKPQNIRIEPRSSFAEAQSRTKGYIKNVAVIPPSGSPGTLEHRINRHFSEMLTTAMQSKSNRLTWAPFALSDPAARDPLTWVASARSQGFHHLLDTAVMDVRVSEKRTGIWWMRKTRYFMTVIVHLDIYDTYTAAKVTSKVREQVIKIDSGIYETFADSSLESIPALNKTLAAMAGKLGKHAADTITAAPLKTIVSDVDGERIELAAGQAAGLRVGDRWAVYEGRRTVEGYGGQRFIAPGYKLGTIHITAVSDTRAVGRLDQQVDIRVGDVAVPAK
jgi:hypothetical protein